MAEVDVEPVFKTPRQRVVRDVLTAVVGCAVLWFLFLSDLPALLDAVLLLGGGVVTVLFVVARARSIFPLWPDRRFWNLLVNAAIALASVLLLPYVPNEIAWAGVGSRWPAWPRGWCSTPPASGGPASHGSRDTAVQNPRDRRQASSGG